MAVVHCWVRKRSERLDIPPKAGSARRDYVGAVRDPFLNLALPAKVDDPHSVSNVEVGRRTDSVACIKVGCLLVFGPCFPLTKLARVVLVCWAQRSEFDGPSAALARSRTGEAWTGRRGELRCSLATLTACS